VGFFLSRTLEIKFSTLTESPGTRKFIGDCEAPEGFGMLPNSIRSVEEHSMTNQTKKRGGNRDEDDDDTKYGKKQNGGKNQGSKTRTGTTRAGEENTRGSD
jgi:hypothetical protein